MDDLIRDPGRQSASSRQGRAYERHVRRVVEDAGYTVVWSGWTHPASQVEVDLVVTRQGQEDVWFVECKGSWESPTRNGLERTDTLKKAVGSAFLINTVDPVPRFVIATSDLPKPGSVGETWLTMSLDAGVVSDVWLIPFHDTIADLLGGRIVSDKQLFWKVTT